LRHEDARSVEMAQTHRKMKFWGFSSFQGVKDACPQAKDAKNGKCVLRTQG